MKKNKVDIHLGPRAKLTKPGEDRGREDQEEDRRAAGPDPEEYLGRGHLQSQAPSSSPPGRVPLPARCRASGGGGEPDGKLIWTYFEAMKPEKNAEIAAGHGLGRHRHRFASFYRTMGVDVTVVEVMKTVMPVEDAEISAFRQEAVRQAGHEDPARGQGHQGREGRRFDHRPCRDERTARSRKITADRG